MDAGQSVSDKTELDKRKAVNGRSYRVLPIAISNPSIHKFGIEFFHLKTALFNDKQNILNQWRLHWRSRTSSSSFSLSKAALPKIPEDLKTVRMRAFAVKQCKSEEACPVLWAHYNKMGCPYCLPYDEGKKAEGKRARDCFRFGGPHELILPFWGFYSYDFLIWTYVRRGDKKIFCQPFPSYTFDRIIETPGEAKKVKTVPCCTDTIEVFPRPVNVLSNNKVEVFFLLPRVCIEGMLFYNAPPMFYLWQHKLLDRFVREETFKGNCPTCGANNIRKGPPGYLEGYLFKRALLQDAWKAPITSDYPFENHAKHMVCDTCYASFVVMDKQLFEWFLAPFLDGKGLCQNCYMPVAWMPESPMRLDCKKCGASSPLHLKYSERRAPSVILEKVPRDTAAFLKRKDRFCILVLKTKSKYQGEKKVFTAKTKLRFAVQYIKPKSI